MPITAAELLFKIQQTGGDELKKVALAVGSVGEGTRLAGAQLKTFDATLNNLVGSGKTLTQALEEMSRSQGVLSNSVRTTAVSLLDQMRAVEGDEAAIRRLTGATHEMVGANIAAGSALRDLSGQSNIRGIENLLTKVLGLGGAFQSLFVLTGVVAAGEELYKLWEKYNPLTKATKDLAEENKKLDASYAQVTRQIEGYIEAQARATLGAAGAKAVAAFDVGTQRAEATSELAYLNREIAEKQKHLMAFTGEVQGSFESGQAPTPQVAEDPVIANQIALLRARAEGVQLLLRDLDAKQKTDDVQEKADKDKVTKREALELAKKRAETERELYKGLEMAQAKELTGYDAIRARLQAIVDLKASENALTAKGLEYISQTAVAENAKYSQTLIDKARKLTSKDAVADAKVEGADDKHSFDYISSQFLKNLRAEIAKEEKDIGYMLAAMSRDDASDADGVRIKAQQTVKDNQLATRGGHMSGADAANNDYDARLNAAQQIFGIETRHLDLIDDKDKREEKLAEARKKYADEVYQAEAQHEEALTSAREQDLRKYESLAGKLFDALTNRSRGVGYELQQMLKGAALNTGRQIFTNAATPVLQDAGKFITGLTGGHTLGGLLSGTALDPKNAGTDAHQVKIVDNTFRTAEEVKALRMLFTGGTDTSQGSGITPDSVLIQSQPGVPGSVAGAVSGMTNGTLATLTGGSSSPTSLGTLASIGKLLGISSGGMGNFAAGLKTVASGDALTVMTGNNGAASWGAGIGMAGALAAGGLGIASGISQGGAGGALKAAGSAAAVAGTVISNVSKLLGAVSPALAAAGPIGALAGLGLGMVGSLFGSNVAKRQKEINDDISKNQYLAPTALNVTQGTNGKYVDFDSRGLLRTSTLNAVPTVAEPYITSKVLNGTRQYYNAPGSVSSPFSGSASGSGQTPVSNAPVTNITIHAMDSESFHEFLQKPKNSRAVGESTANHLQTHEGRLSNQIRFITQG